MSSPSAGTAEPGSPSPSGSDAPALTPSPSKRDKKSSRSTSGSRRNRKKRSTKQKDALLVLRVLEAKKLQLSKLDKSGKPPRFELIARLEDREFIARKWKNPMDAKEQPLDDGDGSCTNWNSPSFERLGGRNAFAFKYIVGVRGQPLRLVLCQRIDDGTEHGRLDVLGQCVMKFPKMPLLNRSIRLTHPVGPCKRADLTENLDCFDSLDGRDKLCAGEGVTLTSEVSGSTSSASLGEVKYKCIILERSFLDQLLKDKHCYLSMQGRVSQHLFVMVTTKKLKDLKPVKNAKDEYHPYVRMIFEGGEVTEDVSMTAKKAPAVAHSEETDWKSSHECCFCFYASQNVLQNATLTLKIHDYTGKQEKDPERPHHEKHGELLGSGAITDFSEFSQNHEPATKHIELKDKESNVVGDLELKVTLFDPKELARRCDMKADQYKRTWQRVQKKSDSEKKEIENKVLEKLKRRSKKKQDRSKLLRRIMQRKKREEEAKAGGGTVDENDAKEGKADAKSLWKSVAHSAVQQDAGNADSARKRSVVGFGEEYAGLKEGQSVEGSTFDARTGLERDIERADEIEMLKRKLEQSKKEMEAMHRKLAPTRVDRGGGETKEAPKRNARKVDGEKSKKSACGWWKCW